MKSNLEQAFDLDGDSYRPAAIRKWWQEESEFHNSFIGGRSDSYGIKDDIVNQKVFLKKHLREGRLLDFGCAEGFILKRFLQKDDVLVDYYGVDSSKSLIEAARKNVPTGKFLIRTTSDPLPFEKEFFDFVVLHLSYTIFLTSLKR